jgi:hypothetical protein
MLNLGHLCSGRCQLIFIMAARLQIGARLLSMTRGAGRGVEMGGWAELGSMLFAERTAQPRLNGLPTGLKHSDVN